MNSFKWWLDEQIIRDLLSEAIVRFGNRYLNKPVEQVPAGMWKWTWEKMQESPRWVPNIENDNGQRMTRAEVESLIQSRMGGSSQPQATQRPQQQQSQIKNWVLAKAIGLQGVPPETPVVMSKKPDGWEMMTQDGKSQIIPNDRVASVVQAIRNSRNEPISSDDPQELFQMVSGDGNVKQNVKGRISENMISQHQKAVEQSFLSKPNNIMMDALAGSGKTTMLKHLASYKKPNEKWLYLVFGKKNQLESQGEFPRGVDVLTSHAFLGRLLNSNADNGIVARTDLWRGKGERLPRLLDDMMEYDDTFPWALKYAAKSRIKKIADLAKAYAVNPQNEQEAIAKIKEIIQKYAIDMDLSTEKHQSDNDWTHDIIEKTLDLLVKSLPGKAGDPRMNSQRDHNDTLWYAALNDQIQWPKYDVVLADEVQDFNKAQTIMLQKLAEQGARIVAVGDPNQAVFSFRGADSDSFNNIRKLIGGTESALTHQLPVNYRSCKGIIDYVNQNTHVDNLQAGLDCEGQVTEGNSNDVALDSVTNEWDENRKLSKQTAMISRTNGPLIKSALQLLKRGVDFVVMGKDLSKELTDHIGNVIGKGRYAKHESVQEFQNSLYGYLERLKEKWAGRISKKDELQEMSETTDSLIDIIEHLKSMNFHDESINMNVRNTEDLIKYLRVRFGGVDTETAKGDMEYKSKDPKSFVTLTTAHKSKGLEFDRVYILNNELFPHPKAKTDMELQQEKNLQYVAYTRAREELHILRDS